MTAEPIVEARQRISQAAFRLFGSKGYTCTSIQDIADAAEVKKSIVYYYFSSKEGLYQALLTESSTNLRGFLDQALAKLHKRGSEAQLAAIAELLISLARDNRESVRFFLSHIFAPDADRPPSQAHECMQQPSTFIHQIAVAAIDNGELVGDPTELERLIFGAIQLSIIRHLRNPLEEPLAAGLGQRIVSAAVRGFMGRPAASSRHSAAPPAQADADPA